MQPFFRTEGALAMRPMGTVLAKCMPSRPLRPAPPLSGVTTCSGHSSLTFASSCYGLSQIHVNLNFRVLSTPAVNSAYWIRGYHKSQVTSIHKPGGARRSQGSQEGPGGARRSQGSEGEPRGARGARAKPAIYQNVPGAFWEDWQSESSGAWGRWPGVPKSPS